MMAILMKRADADADRIRSLCERMLQNPTADACEEVACAIRRYDHAVATMLDVVSLVEGSEIRDHDAAFGFLNEHPRFNKTGTTLARESLLGRGKLD